MGALRAPAVLALLALGACHKPSSAADAAVDEAPGDAGIPDAGQDAGEPLPDAGAFDAGLPDAGTPDAGPSLCEGTPDGSVKLPDDDGRHQEAIEWWYWTGHLKAADGRWFGFQQTFFLAQSGLYSAQVVHQAITDVDGGTFHHLQSNAMGLPATPPDGGFQLAVGSQTARGGNGRDVLHGEVNGYVMDVVLESKKAPVFQHGDGYEAYPFGGYTYYYSRQRMAAKGTLSVGGQSLPVEGLAWFDHQWGSLVQLTGLGWDWFALQLDDGRELMLTQVRAQGQVALKAATLSGKDCSSRELLPADFTITPLGEWKNANGCPYPMGWTIDALGQRFTVTPVMPDQELNTALKRYWEGAALVSGDAQGRAYVELTGYCN